MSESKSFNSIASCELSAALATWDFSEAQWVDPTLEVIQMNIAL